MSDQESRTVTPRFTVLTPTYNRRALLSRLFQSLAIQGDWCRNIEWLIVDDGSSDGTEDGVREMASSGAVPIRYIRTENGGKHRAINRGALDVRSEWVVVVDSDDEMVPDAIAAVLEMIDAAERVEGATAIIAPMSFSNRPVDLIGAASNMDGPVSFAEYMNVKPQRDTSILLRSEVLRRYPFHEVPGEKFIAESSMYVRALKEPTALLSNTAIVRAEYQANGLSANSRRNRSAAPVGAMLTYREHLSQHLEPLDRVRNSLNLHRFYWHARAARRDLTPWRLEVQLRWLLPGLMFFLLDRLILAWKN